MQRLNIEGDVVEQRLMSFGALFGRARVLGRRQLVALGLAGALLIGGPLATAFGAAAQLNLFGTQEVPKDNLKPFPKWTGVLERFFKEKANQKCEGDKSKCYYKTWAQFLKSIKDLDQATQVEKVNHFMNQAKYIVDLKNWGVKDHWATPAQFFYKFGDCEDYAIVKFLSLRALGFPSEMLRIVVVKDLNLKVGHAVLAVYLDGKIKILDNQIKQVVEHSTIRHYRPIYSVNEEGWWLHKT